MVGAAVSGERSPRFCDEATVASPEWSPEWPPEFDDATVAAFDGATSNVFADATVSATVDSSPSPRGTRRGARLPAPKKRRTRLHRFCFSSFRWSWISSSRRFISRRRWAAAASAASRSLIPRSRAAAKTAPSCLASRRRSIFASTSSSGLPAFSRARRPSRRSQSPPRRIDACAAASSAARAARCALAASPSAPSFFAPPRCRSMNCAASRLGSRRRAARCASSARSTDARTACPAARSFAPRPRRRFCFAATAAPSSSKPPRNSLSSVL